MRPSAEEFIAHVNTHACCPDIDRDTFRRLPNIHSRPYNSTLDVDYVFYEPPVIYEYLNDCLRALATAGGYASFAEAARVLQPAIEDRPWLTMPGLESAAGIMRAFPDTFDLTRPGRVRLIRDYRDPDPGTELPCNYRHLIHEPDDLERLCGLYLALRRRPDFSDRMRLTPCQLWPLIESEPPPGPAWDSADHLEAFLRKYQLGRYYDYWNGRLTLPLAYRGRVRAVMADAAVRIHADPDGIADCRDFLDLLAPHLGKLGPRPTATRLAARITSFKHIKFHRIGRTRVRVGGYRGYWDSTYALAACNYYPRYLAKLRTLQDGLARTRDLKAA